MTPRGLRRWLVRTWHRRPRVVSSDGYARLIHQLPAEQRRREGQRVQLKRLLGAHRRERLHHRQAIVEKEELKQLLGTVAPERYADWLAGRKELAP